MKKQKQTGIHIFRKDHLNKCVRMECSGTEARIGPLANREGFLEVSSRKKGQFEGGGDLTGRLGCSDSGQAVLCLEVSSFHWYR